ncbi:MAG: MFS transporter [Candidatus Eremiobacteraeota bacterium]|nr:MFS transporter [Candidatus Eremiobacteraeota bacterium]
MTFFMIVLDFSIVSIAMPAIQQALHFDPGDLQWVISAYTIIFAGFLMVAGRLCDLVGRRVIFVVGLLIFTASSLVAGFAHGPAFLVIMRGVQGLGAAMVNPAALALVTDLFEEGAPRNRALSLWGVIGSAGLTAGILLGGILTSALGWRAVFFVNVPIGVALLALTPILVPRELSPRVRERIDYVGALLMTAGILLLIYAIEEIAEDGLLSFATLWRLALAIVVLSAFVFAESRVRNPVMPLSVFRLPNLTPSANVATFQAAAYAALFVYASIYFQSGLHWAPWRAAMAFLPMSILLTAFAGPFSAPLATRFGGRPVGITATALMIAGGIIMTLINPHTSYWIGALPGTVIAGFGCMITYQMSMMVGLAHIPPDQTGAASGILSTAIQVGLSLGVAIGGTVFETTLGTRGAFLTSIAFMVLVGISFLTMRGVGAAKAGTPIVHHHLPFGKLIFFSRDHHTASAS